MMVSKRNLLFQGLLFRFHVKFRGCNPMKCPIPSNLPYPQVFSVIISFILHASICPFAMLDYRKVHSCLFIHFESPNPKLPGPFILHWWPPALIHGIRSGSGLGLITGANPRAETGVPRWCLATMFRRLSEMEFQFFGTRKKHPEKYHGIQCWKFGRWFFFSKW